jgi:hypothetical protein
MIIKSVVFGIELAFEGEQVITFIADVPERGNKIFINGKFSVNMPTESAIHYALGNCVDIEITNKAK